MKHLLGIDVAKAKLDAGRVVSVIVDRTVRLAP